MSHSNCSPKHLSKNCENSSRQILIVEDNLLNLKLMSAITVAQGYRVLEAQTGVQGLELARRHHPALIVMDLRLPDISGLQVTRELKAASDTADIVIIAASAHAAGDDEAREAGCD